MTVFHKKLSIFFQVDIRLKIQNQLILFHYNLCYPQIIYFLILYHDVLHQENANVRFLVKFEKILFVDSKDYNEIKLIDFGFSTVCQLGKKLKVFCGTPSCTSVQNLNMIDEYS